MDSMHDPAYPVHGSMGEVVYSGITIREAFILAAMQGYIAAGHRAPIDLCNKSIETADVMLAMIGYQ